MSGIRPQLKIGERRTSCIVRSLTEEELFLLDQVYEVDLELIFRDEYQDLLNFGDPIELFDGSRLIAVGEWVGQGKSRDA
jgi:hypothetical protein